MNKVKVAEKIKRTFHKYPKVFVIGYEENKDMFLEGEDEIVIEEKIDGANFRFYINQFGEIIFGSRGQELSEDKDHKFQKNFERCIRHIKEKLYGLDLEKFKGLIFYGENCVKHTLNYDWSKIPAFLGFDIMNLEDKFLDWKDSKGIYETLGLDFVPIVKVCNASEIPKIDDTLLPKSLYAETKAEGIVLKNYNKQIFAKYVSDLFKEDNRKAFGHREKNADDDTSEVIFKYCTNQRIEKCIFKLLDEGEWLELKIMHRLPKMVLDDIQEEHARDIYQSNWKIDFKKLRQLVPKRCLIVLNQVIVNNSLK